VGRQRLLLFLVIVSGFGTNPSSCILRYDTSLPGWRTCLFFSLFFLAFGLAGRVLGRGGGFRLKWENGASGSAARRRMKTKIMSLLLHASSSPPCLYMWCFEISCRAFMCHVTFPSPYLSCIHFSRRINSSLLYSLDIPSIPVRFASRLNAFKLHTHIYIHTYIHTYIVRDVG
jgi:hypothetical protein